MIWLIVIVLGGVGAILYVAIGSNPSTPTTAAATRVAELARITYAAAIFAIMFALTLGLHETFVRLVK